MVARIVRSAVLAGLCLLAVACAGTRVGNGSSELNQQDMVKSSLDRLVSAYESKNSRQFNELVSDRYAGEKSLLDSAVSHDFSAYHNLSVRYTFNNVTFDGKDKVFASVTFTREWTDIATSGTKSDTRETSLVFILENGNYKLYSQERPLLFGFK